MMVITFITRADGCHRLRSVCSLKRCDIINEAFFWGKTKSHCVIFCLQRASHPEPTVGTGQQLPIAHPMPSLNLRQVILDPSCGGIGSNLVANGPTNRTPPYRRFSPTYQPQDQYLVARNLIMLRIMANTQSADFGRIFRIPHSPFSRQGRIIGRYPPSNDGSSRP